MACIFSSDFFKIEKYFIKMSQITKVIYETLVNLLILNKFLLCYMGLRPIFRKKTSKVRTHRDPFCKILVWFNEQIRKGRYWIQYEALHFQVFNVPALRCIYTIMKSCSKQSSCRDFYTLLSCLAPF